MTLETIEQERLGEPTLQDLLEADCNSLRDRLDAAEAQAAAWQARAIEIGQKYDGIVQGIRELVQRLAKPEPMAYVAAPTISTEYEALDEDVQF